MRRGAILAIFGLLGFAGAPLHAEAPVCATAAATVRGAAVVDDLDIALEDGRTLKLAGLDPARPTSDHPELGEAARRRLEAAVVGRDLAVAFLSAAPDRWDRYPALVMADAGQSADAAPVPGLSINQVLIAEGWARVRADPVLRPCLSDWLAMEARAREAGLGLWSDPYYSIIDVDDREGLSERAGAMAVVEGRVRRVQSQGRVALRLGGAGGLVAFVTRSGATALSRGGRDPAHLMGARLRLRGFLDDRFGPRIDVTDAGQIEVMDAGAGRRNDDRTMAAPPAPVEPESAEQP